jgi:cytochrome c-type biogenesis protein CcmH
LAPDNPKALLYAGFAAAVRGDKATARARWEALKALHPPPQIEQMLDERIAELGPAGTAAPATAGAALAAGVAPAVASAAGPGLAPAGPAADAGAGSAEATVNISLAPALKARLTGAAPLFVFAAEPGVRGPPLAAKRLTTAAIGTRIQLSAADSMIPGRVLVNGRKVSITARVSFSGQPLPAAGDLYGEVIYDVGHDGTRDLVIDKIAQ